MAQTIIDQCIEAVLWGMDKFSDLTQQVEFEGRMLGAELRNGVGRLMKPAGKQNFWEGEVRKPKRVR